MSEPCRSDLACCRNDGHDGDHVYATPETLPRPVLTREEARTLADELAEALGWPVKFSCFREDDDDCQAHYAEWPIENDVCEWALSARAALAKWEASRE